MKTYIIHATVHKYDEGLKGHTKSNVNAAFKAKSEGAAKSKAINKFTADHTHPKISNIRVEIDLVNKI